jgi:hypothetical protein
MTRTSEYFITTARLDLVLGYKIRLVSNDMLG